MMYAFTIELWVCERTILQFHNILESVSTIMLLQRAKKWMSLDVWNTPMKTAITWLQSARMHEVLESCDVHLFGPLKKHLGGQRFQTFAELQAVLQWSCSQSPQFHAEGIQHSLITFHENCMNFCDNYVEKYVTVQFSLDKCYSE
jgi:hypothetical protein